MRLPVLLGVVTVVGAVGAQATHGTQASDKPVIPRAEYAARRAALAAQVREGAILVLGAREPNQDFLTFYQTPSFDYLTGVHEPDAALLIVKAGARSATTIFVQPNDPAREVWTGARLGPQGAGAATGLAGLDVARLRPLLDSLLEAGESLHLVADLAASELLGVVTQSPDGQLVAGLRTAHPKAIIDDISATVQRLRGRKTASELAQIRRAAEITVAAQREALTLVTPGGNEHAVQALIEYTFSRHGADRPSFATIVGSGRNATTLHYNANDRVMQAGDLVVMDIGASVHGYAADVTRTVPVSGTFTPAQRQIYTIVRAAQAAGERQAQLGARANLMEDSARVALAAGLAKLGLIDAPEAMYDCDIAATRSCPQYRLYYMHALGHGIGLEVHDPDQFYFTGTIAPGSAFTIEPGIYVRSNLLEIIPRTPRNQALIERLRGKLAPFAGIGVRIEDDYVATESGVEWVSRLPREAEEIERLMRKTRG
ncbi:MAG: aminopeptidase P N-terminal domain-containing protein [Gemmatimonadaceae bacterium]